MFDSFSYDQLLWIVLGLAWAITSCAKRDDPVLVELFGGACEALKDAPRC